MVTSIDLKLQILLEGHSQERCIGRDVLLAEKVSEVCDGVFGVADQLGLSLSSV